MRALSLLELRVLGVLVEKQHTVADSYPLSLNALLMGCNQKTARDPVINASEGELLAAIDELKALGLVIESSGSRVMRYEHNVGRVLKLPSQAVALLATLILRGPQTAAELRTHADRLHHFADISSVEAFLDELAERSADHGGALAVRLARAPGARESRWAQLLGGPVDAGAAVSPVGTGASEPADVLMAGEVAALKANQQRLQAEVDALRVQLQRLAASLGAELG